MRALPLLLLLLAPSPAWAQDPSPPPEGGAAAEPVMWMRSMRLEVITTEAQPDAEVKGTLIAAEPRYRPCAEYLPPLPPERQPPVRIALALWEEGGVRAVRVLDEVPGPLDRATRCLTDVLQGLRFPGDPGLSDERRVEATFQARWDAAKLGLVAVSQEQLDRMDVADPTVEGRVDLVSISARIDSIRPRLTRCIRLARRRSPEAGRRITVRLRLAQNREEPDAPEAWLEGLSVVESDLGDEQAEVCVVRELERLSWPRPWTSVAFVTWPFLFER